MMAIAIFAIGILAVTSMQLRSIGLNATARTQTEATTLAVDRMEQLLALPYDDPLLDEGNSPWQAQTGSYTIEWNVSEDVDLPMKHITISVTSQNRNSRPIAISSIKAQGS
jgi:Tfp pilus assembly protein PilV